MRCTLCRFIVFIYFTLKRTLYPTLRKDPRSADLRSCWTAQGFTPHGAATWVQWRVYQVVAQCHEGQECGYRHSNGYREGGQDGVHSQGVQQRRIEVRDGRWRGGVFHKRGTCWWGRSCLWMIREVERMRTAQATSHWNSKCVAWRKSTSLWEEITKDIRYKTVHR